MLETEPSFTRGMLVSLAIYAASLPVALLPPIGPMLSLTMVPYLSSALGTRLAHQKERIPLAITAAIIWSSIESGLVIILMRMAANSTPMGFRLERLGTLFLVIIWAMNIVFGTLGAVHPWKDPFSDPERSERAP
jgi:hypothetical protein